MKVKQTVTKSKKLTPSQMGRGTLIEGKSSEKLAILRGSGDSWCVTYLHNGSDNAGRIYNNRNLDHDFAVAEGEYTISNTF